jgi:hypothetical protein
MAARSRRRPLPGHRAHPPRVGQSLDAHASCALRGVSARPRTNPAQPACTDPAQPARTDPAQPPRTNPAKPRRTNGRSPLAPTRRSVLAPTRRSLLAPTPRSDLAPAYAVSSSNVFRFFPNIHARPMLRM